MDLVEKFKKEIREEKIKRVQIKKEKEKERALNPEAKVFRRSELLKKYTVKICLIRIMESSKVSI